jgi:hypothetical protein
VVYDHVAPGSPLWMGAILLGIACLLFTQVKVKKGTKQILQALTVKKTIKISTSCD